MSDYTTALSPEQELDLSGEGLQRTRAVFEITDTEMNPSKSGQGTVLHVAFEATEPVDEQDGFRADTWLTIRHQKSSVAKRGMAELKRLFQGVYGSPEGTIAGLAGKLVSAEVWEDKDGFRRIGRFQPVTEDAETSEAAAPATAGISL